MTAGYATNTQAAHAWAKHRGLALKDIADWTLADLAAHLVERDPDGRPDPVPQYVLRTIAEQEQP